MDNDGGKLLNEDNDLRSVRGFCSFKILNILFFCMHFLKMFWGLIFCFVGTPVLNG